MVALAYPHRNRVVTALPKTDISHLTPHLSRVTLRLRDQLLDGHKRYACSGRRACFRCHIDGKGATVEVGVVGREGVVGLSSWERRQMPGQTYIQIPGNGFRIEADRQKDEFERPGELRRHRGHITLARCNMYGTIKRVIRDRGFGFIRSQDGEEVFFHRTSVEKRLDFDALREGQRVEFDLQRGDKGPRAASVRSGPGELMSA